MTAPFDLAVRASVVVLVALFAAALLCRQSAALRHRLLAAGLAGSLAIAPLSWVTPAVILMAPAAQPPLVAPMPIDVVGPARSGAPPVDASSVWTNLLQVWIAGSALRGLWLILVFERLRRQLKRMERPGNTWDRLLPGPAAAMGVGCRVSLRAVSGQLAPGTWGWRRAVIMVPESAFAWPATRVRLVLLHELAHVRRHDWAIQLLGEIACALYWFNPSMWLARNRLRRESERACDDLVLGCGISADRYGTELVDIARQQAGGPYPAGAVPMARTSSLERRIVAMLDPTIDRRPLTRRAALACGALVLASLMPAAALRLAAQEEVRSFTVQVFDPTGAVLPGTTVELVDAGQSPRSATTEGSGRAVFDEVSPGDYTISASLPGFRQLRATIIVGAARDRQRSITLQVAELTETVTVRERRPPAGTSPLTRGAVEPLRIGGNIRAPRKLQHSAPEYPVSMREAGLEGIVPLEALIGRDGTVTSVRVLSADVHPEFARSASEAVGRWVFSPTLLNGEAVEVRMAVSVRFSLQD